jgi:hypothetical protein
MVVEEDEAAARRDDRLLEHLPWMDEARVRQPTDTTTPRFSRCRTSSASRPKVSTGLAP